MPRKRAMPCSVVPRTRPDLVWTTGSIRLTVAGRGWSSVTAATVHDGSRASAARLRTWPIGNRVARHGRTGTLVVGREVRSGGVAGRRPRGAADPPRPARRGRTQPLTTGCRRIVRSFSGAVRLLVEPVGHHQQQRPGPALPVVLGAGDHVPQPLQGWDDV